MTQKIIIAASGTGGHVYPGICLARELRNRGCEIRFIIAKDDSGHFTQILEQENFQYCQLKIKGLPRKIAFRLIYFFPSLFLAFINTLKMLSLIKPDVVVGLGGHVSFPVVCLAKLKNIHTVIHEQNFLPGLANKILSKMVDKIAVSFTGSVKYFPEKKTSYTGNPVRQELIPGSENVAVEFTRREKIFSELGLDKGKFSVLVFGGSQGSHFLNKLIIDSLEYLSDVSKKIQFIHLTGKKNYDWVLNYFKESGTSPKIIFYPYFDQIGELYNVADLVICRSGATTVAELTTLRKPAILVPYPYATDRHQEYNAQVLIEQGSAIMIKQDELDTKKISEVIISLINQPDKLVGMKNSYPQVPPGGGSATKLLADLITQ